MPASELERRLCGSRLGGQPAVRRVLVDGLWQFPRETGEEFVSWEACLLRKGFEHVRSDGLFELIGCEVLVRPAASP
jgi:hypothetical protein